jgi:hypothetical protein
MLVDATPIQAQDSSQGLLESVPFHATRLCTLPSSAYGVPSVAMRMAVQFAKPGTFSTSLGVTLATTPPEVTHSMSCYF